MRELWNLAKTKNEFMLVTLLATMWFGGEPTDDQLRECWRGLEEMLEVYRRLPG